MADDTTALHAPRETTTVWRLPPRQGVVNAEPTTTVATLRDAGDPLFDAQVEGATFVDPERCRSSGIVNIQIVKRGGTFIPVIDGLVPKRAPLQPTAPAVGYVLSHHRQLHRVDETQTWVFSPCAVSLYVEDGAQLPGRCTVSVWQQMTRAASAGTENIGPEVMLGDREVKPFGASDHTAPIVYVPYPVVYSRAPRIIIKDMTPVYTHRDQQRKRQFWQLMSVAMPFLYDLAYAAISSKLRGMAAAVRAQDSVTVPDPFATPTPVMSPPRVSIADATATVQVGVGTVPVDVFAQGTAAAAAAVASGLPGQYEGPAVSTTMPNITNLPADERAGAAAYIADVTGLGRIQAITGVVLDGTEQVLDAADAALAQGAAAAGAAAGAVKDAATRLAEALGVKTVDVQEEMKRAREQWFDAASKELFRDDAQTVPQQTLFSDPQTAAFFTEGIPTSLSFVAALGVLHGFTGAQAAASVLGPRYQELFSRRALFSGSSTWSELFAQVIPSLQDLLLDRNTIMSAVAQYVAGVLQTPVTPLPTKKHYSIAKLADILEHMTALVSAERMNNALRCATDQQTFADELVIFRWLMESEAPAEAASLLDMVGLPPNPDAKSNVADMSEFSALIGAAVRTHLRVEIEDPESCAFGDRAVFEFKTDRADAALMGLAASGMLQDLERLERAIRAFEARVREQKDKLTWGDSCNCYWDYVWYNPLFTLVLCQWKYIRSQQQQTRDNEVLFLLGHQRSRTLNFLYNNLHDKLYRRFVNVGSPGQLMMTRLRLFNPPSPTLPSPRERKLPLYTRELPHKVQDPVLFFPAAKTVDAAYVDIDVQSGTMREYSALNDAVKASMRSASAAMDATARMHRKWETSGPRCMFVHAFGTNTPANDALAILHKREPLIPPNESYSLVLQLPGDIRSAEAAAQLEEQTRRRIVAICHKGASAQANRSLLANVAVPDTEPALVAAELFSELWTDELITLHELDRVSGIVVAVTETAQRRAAQRVAACARFVLAITAQEWTGIVPSFDNDPALQATQAGRDAARLARRMQLKIHARSTRGLLPSTTVRHVRAVGSMLLEVGNRLAAKAGADILPSEPLQSLFMSSKHGLLAFQRASALSVPPEAVSAIASAYPAMLLVTPEVATGAVVDVREPTRPSDPKSRIDFASLTNVIKQRTAALRVDWDHTNAQTSAWPSEKGLTDAMRALSVHTKPKSALFYVPYGHGHAPPRLVYPPVPAPMLGSVPVWLDDVRYALQTLTDAIQTSTPPQGMPWSGRISPIYQCDSSADPPEHPVLLEVHSDPSKTSPDQFDVSYWAAAPEIAPTQKPLQAYTTALDAAKAHVQTDATRRLASRTDTMAWNAERTMQSMLTLVGLEADDSDGNGSTDPRGAITLCLGDGDTLVGGFDRKEPLAQKQARLEQQRAQQEGDARLYAERHFAELRRAMELVDRAAANFGAFQDVRKRVRVATGSPFVGEEGGEQGALRVAANDVTRHVLAGDESVRANIETGVAPALLAASVSYIVQSAAAGIALAAAARFHDHATARAAAEAIMGSKETTGVTATQAQGVADPYSFPNPFGARPPFVGMTAEQQNKSTEEGRLFLVKELNRLRDPSTPTLSDLMPMANAPWRVWAAHMAEIHKWAIEVYLDDKIYKWSLPIPEASTEGVPNPSAEKRKEYFDYVIGTGQSEPEGSDLEFVRNLAIVHYSEFKKVEAAIQTLDADRAVEEAQQKAARQQALQHTVIATAVGMALARATLGSGAPSIRAVVLYDRGNAPRALETEEQAVLNTSLQTALKAVAPRSNNRAPTALRFSELCTIMQQVLP